MHLTKKRKKNTMDKIKKLDAKSIEIQQCAHKIKNMGNEKGRDGFNYRYFL